MNNDVLVIGAGVAGIEASLLLAKAGRKVFLVEKSPLIGGKAVKYEEAFPNMECSTCMVAPRQQELLQSDRIELLRLAELISLEGEAGNFTAKIKVEAPYVSSVDCIGCGACYEPCPVSIINDFEEKLGERKAIYVPCIGALPNVPVIDTKNCVRWTKGEECTACMDNCVFGAIDFSMEDKTVELKIGAVIVATGFEMVDLSRFSELGYGFIEDIYSSMEFERLFASNGPTSGKIVLKNGEKPRNIAIVHCAGRDKVGYCSGVCCMNSAKFSKYIHHKIHDANIMHFHKDICVPGKKYQAFWDGAIAETGAKLSKYDSISIEKANGMIVVKHKLNGSSGEFVADMVVLSEASVPSPETAKLAEIIGISLDKSGFINAEKIVETSRSGVFVAGCASGPKNFADSVAGAFSAVAKVLSM